MDAQAENAPVVVGGEVEATSETHGKNVDERRIMGGQV